MPSENLTLFEVFQVLSVSFALFVSSVIIVERWRWWTTRKFIE